jgi:hypothetical protein
MGALIFVCNNGVKFLFVDGEIAHSAGVMSTDVFEKVSV